MATVKKRSVAAYYLAAATWLAWAIFGRLYRPLDYLFCAGVSIVVFVVGKAIWPNRTWTVPDQEPEPAAPAAPRQEQAAQPADNPEIDALTAERDKAVAEMRRLNKSIEDPIISAQIDRLEATTTKIIDVVVEKPEKLSQIRKFLNYYLPTTLKLLNAYDRMDAAGVSGVNIDGTKGKIEDMMATICTAFEKQLDSLFGDEALDISADITVMEQMLAQEGIGGMTMGGV